MSPDDPRHGTPRGYYAHKRAGQEPCRECRAAVNRYNNYRRMGRIHPQVNAIGTTRRLRALMAIGWDQRSLARELGWGNTRVSNLVRCLNPEVTAATAAKVAAVYERLTTTPRTGTRAARYARTIAAARGWAPPLAWDDIDHDPAPILCPDPVESVDEVLVQRILDGQRQAANPAERAEVVRRWLAAGRSLKSLEVLTGWNGKRELDRCRELMAS